MKNIPERIYLQIDADGETPQYFNELHQVSWCSDKINDNDIEYTLVSSEKAKEKDLLIDFMNFVNEDERMHLYLPKEIIDRYIKSINK